VNQIRARAANPAGFVQKATQGATRDAYTLVFDAKEILFLRQTTT
jgi:hypothetical protein